MPQILSSYHPLSKKGVANRSLDNLTLIIAYSVKLKKAFSRFRLVRRYRAAFQLKAAFLFPRRATRGFLAAGRPVARDAVAWVWPPWLVRSLLGLLLQTKQAYDVRPRGFCGCSWQAVLLVTRRCSGVFPLPFVRREGVRGWVP